MAFYFKLEHEDGTPSVVALGLDPLDERVWSTGLPPTDDVPEIPYEPLSRRWLASSQFV
jgi:hypothetical protein